MGTLRQSVEPTTPPSGGESPEGAGVVGTTNPRFWEQKYLLPAPDGIGVVHAWMKGADGRGCHLIDIEHAWLRSQHEFDQHEDLRSLDKDAPLTRSVQQSGRTVSHALVGGLHHQYVRI